ncbi:cobalamin B12-binding domain-containing protein [Gaoshiqia sediminis]|uniref:Corrinoid protein n=1 Tax=Gaoshiqia sediminis TaxID=2986998 RepID=A0AA41YBP1_9BACT|nr:corrinoid protein [Gaoshiqia sediminis]MCW0481797.1 corrinoid protein [Gaoshiqia sediminis]
MNELLTKLAECVEFGKINKAAPFPPQMKGQDGADEITRQALDSGVPAQDILGEGLMPGMERVGIKFRENKVFVPQVLMSAKAMSTAMVHLKPYFASGEAKQKGTFIIGTVQGDLHDIGKNLVAMMVEGNGYKVVDLGTDCPAEKYLAAIRENPGAVIGLSALLTTTMTSMEKITREIKNAFPETLVAVGGAPVNDDFRLKIGADVYAPDPQGVVEFLNTKIA